MMTRFPVFPHSPAEPFRPGEQRAAAVNGSPAASRRDLSAGAAETTRNPMQL
jgi:hypothetical protein